MSFDVPYPADYGGVIDVFSRVIWFSENGWKVVLHCFMYKRPQAIELEKYAEVHYYARPLGWKYIFSKLPYIVKTRIDKNLVEILKNTKDEVLLEGLHCAYYLDLQPGKFYLRTHNIEHKYYQKLAEKARGIKRLYYLLEAKKLENFEPILKKAKALLVISDSELAHFKQLNESSFAVPPSFHFDLHHQKTEPYVLFHGNLSVEENEAAAFWILKHLAPKLENQKLIFAGKNPSSVLQNACEKGGVELVADPSPEKMEQLLFSARVHFLWTQNDSGLKLKFLHALATSGHVICSPEMAKGSKLTEGFHVVKSEADALEKIEFLLGSEFSEKEWLARMNHLTANYGDDRLKKIFSLPK